MLPSVAGAGVGAGLVTVPEEAALPPVALPPPSVTGAGVATCCDRP